MSYDYNNPVGVKSGEKINYRFVIVLRYLICILQSELNFISNVRSINENMSVEYFIGLGLYCSKSVFDSAGI